MSPARVPAGAQRGPLMAIGGSHEQVSHISVLQHFWSLAGGYGARIAILATITAPEQGVQALNCVFKAMEAARSEVIWLRERGDALDPATQTALEGATGIFIIGAKPLRLASILGGTPTAQLLRRMNARGVLVGGIGAGAAILTEHMVAYGSEDTTPFQHTVNFAPGLGLTNRLIVDQQFAHHQQFGRLITAVAHNPFLLGVGLDDDTAVVLDAANCLNIVGRRSVVIVDGSELSHTNIHDISTERPVAMLGLRLHVLTQNFVYSVDERMGSLPDPEMAQRLEAQQETFERSAHEPTPPAKQN